MRDRHAGIEELSFAEVIGDRFGRYSKYIIQDRALPDVRDGLKPVQRRILYAMYRDRNTADKPYRKAAKTVGNVIGNYHPHGDSSVYDAMVRMAQDWKYRDPLIDMHGNKGSMDGDPPAAMRYTEARLSEIAETLLEDLDKDTVEYGLNFDDSLKEPRVLPAGFPNLLVNGATGISAGYATDIPPHNLGEVMDALVHMLTHDSYDLDDILEYIQGPDFPTGATIQGAQALKEIYQTGQGKLVVRAQVDIEPLKGGKSQLVARDLPYEVNKASLIQKIDDIRLQKKVEGIVEVRDESDRQGVRLVVELRRDVDSEGILNYLYQQTDLQKNYHFNMTAIQDRRPVRLGLIDLLEAYIAHRKEVVRNRTQFQLQAAQARLHIVDGLIRMLSVLDAVIARIRESDSKAHAKDNLQKDFAFSEAQAEAIVSLQLYRLTNTDVVALQEERLDLNESVAHYQNILGKDRVLKEVIKGELLAVKARFASPRRTRVQAQIESLDIEKTLLVPYEEVMVSVTREGYVKRTSLRSFGSTDTLAMGARDLDYVVYVDRLTSYDHLVLLTSQGNYLHLPVHELPDSRWKDLGIHLSQRYALEDGEKVVFACQAAQDLEAEVLEGRESLQLLLVTQAGMAKQVPLVDFTSYRSYKTRTSPAIKFKHPQDQLVSVIPVPAEDPGDLVLVTARSYTLRYPIQEIASYSLKAQGVIAMNLKEDDQVVAALRIDPLASRPQVLVLTHKGHLKRFDADITGQASRGSRGTLVLRELKGDPHRVLAGLALNAGNIPIVVKGDTGQDVEMMAFDVPLTQRLHNGSPVPGLEGLGQVLTLHPARLTLLDDPE